jgi:hypothetical protein
MILALICFLVFMLNFFAYSYLVIKVLKELQNDK